MTEPCACLATRPVSTDSSRSPSLIFSLSNFLAVILFSSPSGGPPAWPGRHLNLRGVSSAARPGNVRLSPELSPPLREAVARPAAGKEKAAPCSNREAGAAFCLSARGRFPLSARESFRRHVRPLPPACHWTRGFMKESLVLVHSTNCEPGRTDP